MAKSIFITGAASGIGRAVAVLFGQKGWFVGLADINEAGIAETAALLPAGMSSTHRLDVRDRKAWDDVLASFVANAGGRLDVMFNNAGIARGGPFSEHSTADHDLLIDINYRGVVYGAAAAFTYLKANPGSCLINTGSASGIYGTPGLASYSATKFAVRGLTEALDIEWTPHQIRVKSLMPGFINTPLLDVTSAGSNRTAREDVVDAGLEFTPVETVAQAAWDAATSSKAVHHPVGKTAKQLRFMARWAPGFLRKSLLKSEL